MDLAGWRHTQRGIDYHWLTLTFILEHDHKFVIITLIVLVILLFSIFYLCANTIGQRPSGTNNIHYSLLTACLIFLGSIIAGLVGSLVGLGGGVLVVPLLTLVFHFPIEYATRNLDAVIYKNNIIQK